MVHLEIHRYPTTKNHKAIAQTERMQLQFNYHSVSQMPTVAQNGIKKYGGCCHCNISNKHREDQKTQIGASENFQIHMTLEPDYKNFKDKYEIKEELLTNFTSQTTCLNQGPSI
jgi:hypothetical protein